MGFLYICYAPFCVRFVCVKIHVSRYKNILPPFLKYLSIVTSRVSIPFDPSLIKLEPRGLISRVYAHMCMSPDEYLIGFHFTKFLSFTLSSSRSTYPFIKAYSFSFLESYLLTETADSIRRY